MGSFETGVHLEGWWSYSGDWGTEYEEIKMKLLKGWENFYKHEICWGVMLFMCGSYCVQSHKSISFCSSYRERDLNRSKTPSLRQVIMYHIPLNPEVTVQSMSITSSLDLNGWGSSCHGVITLWRCHMTCETLNVFWECILPPKCTHKTLKWNRSSVRVCNHATSLQA